MTGPVTTEALVEVSPFTQKPGLSALGGVEWLEAIAAKYEAGGAGIGCPDHMAASLRHTAGEIRAVVAALQQVTAERDEARKEASDLQNDWADEVAASRRETDRADAAEASLATATSELARLRAEGEAKDRALKEIESQSRRWIRRDRISPNDVIVRDDGQHFKVLALNGIGRIARAACAATARKGQADA